MELFYILSLVTLCSSVDPPKPSGGFVSDEYVPHQGWFPRGQNPRRPPPPFDLILRPYRPDPPPAPTVAPWDSDTDVETTTPWYNRDPWYNRRTQSYNRDPWDNYGTTSNPWPWYNRRTQSYNRDPWYNYGTTPNPIPWYNLRTPSYNRDPWYNRRTQSYNRYPWNYGTTPNPWYTRGYGRTWPPATSETPNPFFDRTTQKPRVLYKINCDPCMPGWGLKSMCNEKSHTVCAQCPWGTWSPRMPHYRACTPCSKCGDGLYEEIQCTSTRDTKCDSCANPKNKFHIDFMRHCDWRSSIGATDTDWDGRLDVEVADIKSKEAAGEIIKPDTDSEESQEKDITVDDPEIDSDLPDDKYDEENVDVSKEEEAEWARVMAARRQARKELEEISERFDKEQLEMPQKVEDDVGDDEDDIAQPIPKRWLRPSRPLPQRMPVPEKTIHVEPEDDIVRPIEPEVENNFPPSYHGYPVDSLAHAGVDQRRKAIVLLVLASAVVISTLAFIVCYVREYCRRQASYNRVVVVNLTPEEREIVRQSAHKLEAMEQPVKKYRFGGNGYSRIIEAESQSSVYVTENPLEEYMNTGDERHVEKENLTDSEVIDEPVYRTTTQA